MCLHTSAAPARALVVLKGVRSWLRWLLFHGTERNHGLLNHCFASFARFSTISVASRRIMGDRMDELHRGIEEALVPRAKLTLIKDILKEADTVR